MLFPSAPTRPPNGRKSAARPEGVTARRAAAIGAILLTLAGCATTQPLDPVAPGGNVLPLCRALFGQADAAVDRADVADAGAGRIDGFPWLRVTRPVSSFRFETGEPARRDAWLQRLARADAEARRHELANLPRPAREQLADRWREAATGSPLPTGLQPALADCRERLNADLAARPARMDRLTGAADVPDAYNDWQRVLGLYPLTRLIVLPPIASHQEARLAALDRRAESGPPFRRHAVPPAPSPNPVTPADLERDALGIPRPGAAERAALFDAHAPVWAVETRSRADRPGALVRGADRPEADPSRPVEYRHWSWTRFRGEVLVQLSYVLWFPERPPEDSVDIYAGHLDGLIWRVTLREDGTPLAHESIHPCGCYYTVFAAPGWRVNPPDGSEPVLAPRPAPRPAADERLLIRLESRTHYVAGVETVARDTAAEPLSPLPLDTLRSLPAPGGGRASAFAEDGLIPSSRRAERFLLWPLGVPSPGAMRQWGTHAIAFTSKRHFDDPFLLDGILEAE